MKLFDVFVGEKVAVVLSDIHYNDADEGVGNMVVYGFLLDVDENYIFLGNTANQIDDAIAIKNVARVCKFYEEDMIMDQAERSGNDDIN